MRNAECSMLNCEQVVSAALIPAEFVHCAFHPTNVRRRRFVAGSLT
jgi:hypothetical protein